VIALVLFPGAADHELPVTTDRVFRTADELEIPNTPNTKTTVTIMNRSRFERLNRDSKRGFARRC
jgi:hypothetical protein